MEIEHLQAPAEDRPAFDALVRELDALLESDERDEMEAALDDLLRAQLQRVAAPAR